MSQAVDQSFWDEVAKPCPVCGVQKYIPLYNHLDIQTKQPITTMWVCYACPHSELIDERARSTKHTS